MWVHTLQLSWVEFTTADDKGRRGGGHLTDCIALAHSLALEVLASPEHTHLRQIHPGETSGARQFCQANARLSCLSLHPTRASAIQGLQQGNDVQSLESSLCVNQDPPALTCMECKALEYSAALHFKRQVLTASDSWKEG